jgi:hypothetical protein
MKDILITLSDDEYRKIEWMADRLNVSIKECIKSFIPSVTPPASKKVTSEKNIANAAPDDLVPITKSLQAEEMEELKSIIGDLENNKDGWGSTLGTEIKRQVIENQQGEKSIRVSTYKRLSRWVTPYRWSEREKFVKPKAERISEILFGRRIDRVD